MTNSVLPTEIRESILMQGWSLDLSRLVTIDLVDMGLGSRVPTSDEVLRLMNVGVPEADISEALDVLASWFPC